MLDLISTNPMIRLMDRSMSLANHRLGLIASNLANLDTPGYRTRDFSFQEALRAELGQAPDGVSLARTHPGHLGGGAGAGTGGGRGIDPAFERNDGNSVNLDQQTMLLARTQGQYTLAAGIAQVELRRIYQAIREGAK